MTAMESLKLKFTSSNNVDVGVAKITRNEYDELVALITAYEALHDNCTRMVAAFRLKANKETIQ